MSDSQKKTFDEVVQYYFPGDTAKFIMDDGSTTEGTKKAKLNENGSQ